MEIKQVKNFNSNKVNVSLNEISSSKFVFALTDVVNVPYLRLNNNKKNKNRVLFRKVQNVNSIISICNMIKIQRPQRRKLYLKRFYGSKKPISLRDFFNKYDAIKGHPCEINSIASRFK